jgi:hypothetical protein
MQGAKPQASHIDCPTDRPNLDSACYEECGSIVLEPVNLQGCDDGDFHEPFRWPQGSPCEGQEPLEDYCIIPGDIDPCGRDSFPCGSCPNVEQQQHYIPCKCCGGEVICAEVTIFHGKDVVDGASSPEETFFPNKDLGGCCNGDGYKIIYDPSFAWSDPSGNKRHFKIKCL